MPFIGGDYMGFISKNMLDRWNEFDCNPKEKQRMSKQNCCCISNEEASEILNKARSENMMCDFNKTFRITPEETQRQIEHFHKTLTWDKYCCVCANSIDKPDTEMGYPTERCYCSINGEYRDGRSGNACKNWKAKYPEYEE